MMHSFYIQTFITEAYNVCPCPFIFDLSIFRVVGIWFTIEFLRSLFLLLLDRFNFKFYVSCSFVLQWMLLKKYTNTLMLWFPDFLSHSLLSCIVQFLLILCISFFFNPLPGQPLYIATSRWPTAKRSCESILLILVLLLLFLLLLFCHVYLPRLWKSLRNVTSEKAKGKTTTIDWLVVWQCWPGHFKVYPPQYPHLTINMGHANVHAYGYCCAACSQRHNPTKRVTKSISNSIGRLIS